MSSGTLRPGRRTGTGFVALALLGLVLGSACSAPPAGPAGRPSAPPPAGGATAAPSAPAVAGRLPAPRPWQATAGEVNGPVKELATRLVEVAGTWTGAEDDTGSAVPMGERIAEAGYAPELATALSAVQSPAAAAVTEVVYPQYGGLTADAASVMVFARQSLVPEAAAPATEPTTREMIVDVRLARDGTGTWHVAGIGTSRALGAPIATTPLARAVLDNPRLRIPGPGRDDIATGRVDDRILTVVQELSADHVLDLHVVVTGHPEHVFETNRVSNHSVGRAVDIWAIDDRMLVDAALPDDTVLTVMTRAGQLGATEVGGPVRPPGNGFFTDAVHQDHLHLGVNPAKPAAGSLPPPPPAATPAPAPSTDAVG